MQMQNRDAVLIRNSFGNFRKLGKGLMTEGACFSRMEQLKARWDNFERRHEEMLNDSETDEKDEYFVKDKFSETYEDYLTNMGLYQDHLLLVRRESARNTEQPGVSGLMQDMEVNRAKLPTIVIADFSGDIEDWARFKDTFKEMVIERPNLPNIYKMNYLRSYVKGEAAELLQEIPSGGEHFADAWQVLKGHYDNTRLLTNKLLDRLLALPSMSKDCASELMRVLNGVRNLLRALKALGSPVDHWGHLSVFLTLRKLTLRCRSKWEDSVKQRADPTAPDSFDDLCKFLEAERNALALLEDAKESTRKSSPQKTEDRATTSKGRRSSNFVQASGDKPICPVCKETHTVEQCAKFRQQSVVERKQTLGQKRLCYTCFGAHMAKDCQVTVVCFLCNGRHHTLLHPSHKGEGGKSGKGFSDKKRAAAQAQEESSGAEKVDDPPLTVMAAASSVRQDEAGEALLATASVQVSSCDGQSTVVRALVDQCAQSSFVSEALCQKLQLKRRVVNVPVSGIGEGLSNSRSEVDVAIRPHFPSSFKLTFKAYVLPTITKYRPPRVASRQWPHLKGLQLADPDFTKLGRIDLLLGTQIHARVVQEGLRMGNESMPIATNSKLGWILSGSTGGSDMVGSIVCLQTEGHLDDLLRSFWEVEEPPHAPLLSAEDKMCEEHYVSTTVRLSDGRYQVRLPRKPNAPTDWVNSRQIAKSCLLSLERKFSRNPSLRSDYVAAMNQMVQSNQMRKVSIEPQDYGSHYFLPHHAVVKESSTTTRVRPVFNASARNAAGHSLNENLLTGPNLLPQLVLVLAHWRCYPIAFVADVSKMYLQVRLHPEDWKLQSILWREDPRKPIEHYVLTTVTFGCGPSAYLASRTLRKLAEDDGNKFPLAPPIVHHEMYMDDVLSGAFDLNTASEKRRHLCSLFSAGGFSLAKWMTNDPELLSSFDPSARATEATLKVGLDFSVLGLVWEPQANCFYFNVSLTPLTGAITKRKVLSRIAGLFDPSGWISPSLIPLKIFMQSLWLLTKEWDVALPEAETAQWRSYEDDLQGLPSISIPRWSGVTKGASLELHGFADASKLAYAAVLYVRIVRDGEARVTLLASKTKVAPVKSLSIPRLELCAALLLVKLTTSFLATTDFNQAPVHLWCSEIVTLLPQASWHYVNTKHNPADVASRGCPVSVLRENRLWWNGPEMLSSTTLPWPNNCDDFSQIVPKETEETESNALVQSSDVPPDCDLILRYSSYRRLSKILVHCQRFATKLTRRCKRQLTVQFQAAASVEVSVDELEQAERHLCRMTQNALLSAEIKCISAKSALPKSHPFAKLCPIIRNGLLCVGGRLRNAQINEDRKHPIILPVTSHLVGLLIDDMHEKMFHGGAQLVSAHLRQRYWIPRLKIVLRARLLRCVICLRYGAETAFQRMADLPGVRVTPCRPFKNAGLDYAGPFLLKGSRYRGSYSYKGYFAIFVCMATKAVHLEAVSAYDTSAFLAAFRRFVSRRGPCRHLYSDRGTNFVGADAELRRMHSEGSGYYKSICAQLRDGHSTVWHFNPPSSPHFGGLWESGVKSVKYHLKRMVGDRSFTFEEFSTLLAQIEAILNSRPLTPLPDSFEPQNVLTPAHPLIGESSMVIAEPPLTEAKLSPSEQWLQIQQITQEFWQRWCEEYLSTLQKRVIAFRLEIPSKRHFRGEYV
uniref:Integrase catalytic domain-containing protein n=1 Tax=Trichogramma kaykai TaxID=54128 RepID=A0ABD2VYB7_9HYME